MPQQFNLRAARDRCLVDVEGYLDQIRKDPNDTYSMRMVAHWAHQWITMDRNLRRLIRETDEVAFIGDIF